MARIYHHHPMSASLSQALEHHELEGSLMADILDLAAKAFKSSSARNESSYAIHKLALTHAQYVFQQARCHCYRRHHPDEI
ncbi:MAG: hypothetical protein HC767_04975 [Akkermansiaceae bacterium]|nr:hypothetical protein [Akkermansiaceae bacterium]